MLCLKKKTICLSTQNVCYCWSNSEWIGNISAHKTISISRSSLSHVSVTIFQQSMRKVASIWTPQFCRYTCVGVYVWKSISLHQWVTYRVPGEGLGVTRKRMEGNRRIGREYRGNKQNFRSGGGNTYLMRECKDVLWVRACGESMQSSFSKFMKEQRDSSEELRQKDKVVWLEVMCCWKPIDLNSELFCSINYKTAL